MTRIYSERGSSEHEKKIFAANLNYYIEQSEKTQAQVAKDLGFNATTLNMWCKGNSMPTSGKIQKIADYFHIGKSELVEAVDHSTGWFTQKELHDHLKQQDILFAKRKLDEIKKGIHDIPINKDLFRQSMREKDISKESLSSVTGIDLQRIIQLVREKNSFVSWNELKILNKCLGVNLVDYQKNVTIGASIYNDVISELMYIENLDVYSDTERNIISMYRASDDLTKAMVHRTLGIDTRKIEPEKIVAQELGEPDLDLEDR